MKQKLQMAGWGALGLCCIVLLVAAMKAKGHKTCTNITINIKGAKENIFVNEKDVRSVLQQNSIRQGEDISQINLKSVEEQLEKNSWIKDAELYFDNKQVLYATIQEREPIARVFTLTGHSFYIDSSGMRLPLSDAAIARIPVFTGFTSDNKHLSAPDSALLAGVKNIAQYIIKDTFWNAQTAQVNIASNGNYQLIPMIGNQLIEMGDANDLDEKFEKLFAFYQQVWSKVGFEKYETIDVQYKGQVVAIRRGAPKPVTDTASALQHLMNSDKKLAIAMNDTATSVVLSKPGNATVKPDAKVSAVKDDLKKSTTSTGKTGNPGKKIMVTAKPTNSDKKTNTPAKTINADKKKTVPVKTPKKTNDAKKPQPKAVMKKPGGH